MLLQRGSDRPDQAILFWKCTQNPMRDRKSQGAEFGLTRRAVSLQIGSQAESLVGRTREFTKLPVAVGLGVRDGQQAAQVAGFADGVIVGSAFVKLMLDAPDEAAGLDAVRELAAELAAGVRAR